MNLDSGIGLYAADPESYTEFALLFDPVIKDYHKLKITDAITHPASDYGDLENLGFTDLDPENEMIISTRIRVGRSHKEFAFPPVLQKEVSKSIFFLYDLLFLSVNDFFSITEL